MAVSSAFASARDALPLHPALLVLAAAVAVLCAWELRAWRRLSHVPGPLANSLSILPLTRLATGGRMVFGLKAMMEKYGEFFFFFFCGQWKVTG
jgi:hypothetical protein